VPRQRVSLHDALRAYTINGAYQLRMEHETGSIEEGKRADLVLMAEELRPLMPADLIEILEWFPTGISTMIAEVEWLMESLLRRPRAAPQT